MTTTTTIMARRADRMAPMDPRVARGVHMDLQAVLGDRMVHRAARGDLTDRQVARMVHRVAHMDPRAVRGDRTVHRAAQAVVRRVARTVQLLHLRRLQWPRMSAARGCW